MKTSRKEGSNCGFNIIKFILEWEHFRNWKILSIFNGLPSKFGHVLLSSCCLNTLSRLNFFLAGSAQKAVNHSTWSMARKVQCSRSLTLFLHVLSVLKFISVPKRFERTGQTPALYSESWRLMNNNKKKSLNLCVFATTFSCRPTQKPGTKTRKWMLRPVLFIIIWPFFSFM